MDTFLAFLALAPLCLCQFPDPLAYPYPYPHAGTGTGSVISSNSAQLGTATGQGGTITNPLGGSTSSGTGFSSGVFPQSTVVANSGSSGTGVYPPFPVSFRRKRSYGYPYGSYGSGEGTAYGTAGALRGTATSSGNTYTNPYGSSHSNAHGYAGGEGPYTSSVANSASRGNRVGIFKREVGSDLSPYEVEEYPSFDLIILRGNDRLGGVAASSSGLDPSLFLTAPLGKPSDKVRASGIATSSSQHNPGSQPVASGTAGGIGMQSDFSVSSTS